MLSAGWVSSNQKIDDIVGIFMCEIILKYTEGPYGFCVRVCESLSKETAIFCFAWHAKRKFIITKQKSIK